MGKNKNTKIKSACCKAEVRYSDIAPDFIGDNPKTMKIGTVYLICTKCNNPCDIYSPIRRVWTRNPKTQIIQNKKKVKSAKLTPKELKEIHQNEDF